MILDGPWSCSILDTSVWFMDRSCVARLLKLREEADPFSMDVGVLGRGDIVKVLEVSVAFYVIGGRGLKLPFY